MKSPLYDLHIHTNLSLCSNDPEQTVEAAVKFAHEHGIPTIGIANHVWDCEIPAGSDFYAGQPFSHIMKVRQQIPEELHGVRVLIGAETEFASGHAMLAKQYRDQLDYVLVPHSHIHMVGLVLPTDCTTPALKAQYLADSFCDLVSQDVATAVAHPFGPVGQTIEGVRDILSCLQDEDYAACFALAKKHNTAVELNGSTFAREWGKPEFMYEHERVFSIARDCGCTFTLGSDAHHPAELDDIHLAVKMAEKLGISDDRFLNI